MRQEPAPDHVVRGAHDLRGIARAVERDAVRREDALEREEMFVVGVDERTVEIKQKGCAQRQAHIVAPICHGANSASP